MVRTYSKIKRFLNPGANFEIAKAPFRAALLMEIDGGIQEVVNMRLKQEDEESRTQQISFLRSLKAADVMDEICADQFYRADVVQL